MKFKIPKRRSLEYIQNALNKIAPIGGTTGQYLRKSADGDYEYEWAAASGGGSSDWGQIDGTLSNQTDLQSALDAKADSSSIPTSNNQLTNGAGFITDYTVTQSDVTQHEAALTITESQVSDLGSYLTGITSGDVTTALGFTPTSFDGAYSSLTGTPTIPSVAWPLANSSVDDGDYIYTGTSFATLETLLYDSANGATDYGFRNKTYNAPSVAEWSMTGGDGAGGQDWYTGFYATSGNWRFYDDNNGFGLMYDDDYSSTWTSRSLVDKAYVDANSFYLTSGSIPASRTYSAESSRAFTYYAYDNTSSNWSTRGLVQIGQFNVQLARAVGSNGSFSGHYSINLSSSGFKVWDSVDNKGMEYGADYSANYTDRSIVDKAYVDSVAGGAGGSVGQSFSAYNNSQQTNNTTSFADVTTWTQEHADSVFSFNATAGVLTVNHTGTILIGGNVTMEQTTGNNRAQPRMRIVEGTTQIEGLRSEGYTRQTGTGDRQGLAVSRPLRVTSGDTFKMQISVHNSAYTHRLVSGGTSFWAAVLA